MQTLSRFSHIYYSDSLNNSLKAVALSRNGGWKWKWSLSRVWLFATPWTVAYQAPPSMGFSRQEYWSGLLFPSLGDLPDPGIKPMTLELQVDSLSSEPNRSELPQIKGLSLQRLLIKATHLSEYSSGCTQSYWGFLPPASQVFGTERCLIPGQIASLIPRRAHLTLFPARPVVTSACLTLTHLPVGVQWPRPDPHFP